MGSLKKLLANKNVVTLLGVVLIVVVLYVFYNYRLNQQIQPISVLYAKQTITSRQTITQEMVGKVDAAPGSINLDGSSVALEGNLKDVIGKKVQVNYTIPKGSFFYQGAYVSEDKLADAFLLELKEGEVAYNYNVNINKTYGNSFYPGNYIDIYVRIMEDDEHVIFGKYIENVKILAVKDSSGNHVFESGSENLSPSMIIFAVNKDINKYLRVIEVLNNATLIMVPVNITPTSGTEVSGEEVVTLMNNTSLQDRLDDYLEYIETDTGE